ncbi:MAG: hypothetical protein CME17_03995 [Gemmatimonadetes bacterium]|nr:hypothetical protein [Gemmatimonadota bacterium]
MSLPPLDFTGITQFKARSGGSASGLLSHNGDYIVKIVSATPGMSKQGNAQVTFVCVIQDEDNKGVTVKSWVPYAGNNKNGEPNAKRLWEVLDSAGTTQEQFAKLEGDSLEIDQVCALLKDRDAYVHCEADEYNGRWSSKIGYWINKQRYEDQKAVGAYRTPLPAGAGANASSGNGAAVATAIPAASTAVSTASAGNPLL